MNGRVVDARLLRHQTGANGSIFQICRLIFLSKIRSRLRPRRVERPECYNWCSKQMWVSSVATAASHEFLSTDSRGSKCNQTDHFGKMCFAIASRVVNEFPKRMKTYQFLSHRSPNPPSAPPETRPQVGRAFRVHPMDRFGRAFGHRFCWGRNCWRQVSGQTGTNGSNLSSNMFFMLFLPAVVAADGIEGPSSPN